MENEPKSPNRLTSVSATGSNQVVWREPFTNLEIGITVKIAAIGFVAILISINCDAS